MAAANSSRVLRAPGRLVVSPATDFATSPYPYGGTEVGRVTMASLQPFGAPFLVESEGLGEVSDVLESHNRYRFACILRGWDDEAIQLLMADGYAKGETTQHALFAAPGNHYPGSTALLRALKLVYVPDDPIHVPGVLIYYGVPDWSDGAILEMRRDADFGVGLAIECLRDTQGRILKIGRLADLDL